ncbi:MlaE family ABC transporter permease [Chitinivibrio alkaliphilus]|uniref:ABC transporter, permease protein n=1 Tax=Chitinivibrio alkaliphilus ACht1 TaxID=1313304 RepID=U7DA80_9BACT|nr:ABC transporter permease [Chitinivibrio alkaliphilus]ERP38927.1 ABC transporter, permease protein [Chitinivibrio alkaliphilus ACht1]
MTGRMFIIRWVENIALFSRLTAATLWRVPLIRKNWNLTHTQMKTIGLESLPLVIITALFVGAATVIQAHMQFQGFIPLSYLGFAVSKSIVTELGPVLTAFVVASRISTAIAAEIGSMKTTEQIDALHCLSLDHLRYVVVPKFVASVLMLPVLVIFCELIAFASSTVTALLVTNVTLYEYVAGLKLFFNPFDMFLGIFKTTFFGGAIALSGAYFGLSCEKGAEGIGNATTRAFMLSAILILIIDFFVAFLFL